MVLQLQSKDSFKELHDEILGKLSDESAFSDVFDRLDKEVLSTYKIDAQLYVDGMSDKINPIINSARIDFYQHPMAYYADLKQYGHTERVSVTQLLYNTKTQKFTFTPEAGYTQMVASGLKFEITSSNYTTGIPGNIYKYAIGKLTLDELKHKLLTSFKTKYNNLYKKELKNNISGIMYDSEEIDKGLTSFRSLSDDEAIKALHQFGSKRSLSTIMEYHPDVANNIINVISHAEYKDYDRVADISILRNRLDVLSALLDANLISKNDVVEFIITKINWASMKINDFNILSALQRFDGKLQTVDIDNYLKAQNQPVIDWKAKLDPIMKLDFYKEYPERIVDAVYNQPELLKWIPSYFDADLMIGVNEYSYSNSLAMDIPHVINSNWITDLFSISRTNAETTEKVYDFNHAFVDNLLSQQVLFYDEHQRQVFASMLNNSIALIDSEDFISSGSYFKTEDAKAKFLKIKARLDNHEYLTIDEYLATLGDADFVSTTRIPIDQMIAQNSFNKIFLFKKHPVINPEPQAIKHPFVEPETQEITLF